MSKSSLTLISHPLIQHKLSLIRRRDCSSSKFYGLAKEIGMYLGFAMTENLQLKDVQYPTGKSFPLVATKKPAVLAMLRSGLVLVEGFRTVNPSVRIGHMGIYRNEEQGGKVETYLLSIPELDGRPVIILDMNIATGGTAAEAISRVKKYQAEHCNDPKPISFGCVTAARKGIEHVFSLHPEGVKLFAVTDAAQDFEGDFGYFSKKLYGLQG